MRYSEEIIDEVRQRNDIVDVISSYIKIQKKGANYSGVCPFHNEKTASFIVSPGKQIFRCFGCGAGGNVFSFVMKIENVQFLEALKLLAERSGVKLPEKEYSDAEKAAIERKNAMLAMNSEAARFFYHALWIPQNAGLRYFEKRGLTVQTIKSFGLGYSGNVRGGLHAHLKSKGFSDELIRESGLVKYSQKGIYDAFFDRVMFPIVDVHRNVIGFGARILGDGQPKYLNSAESAIFKKGQNLFGLNLAKTSREDFFLLCEGYMDVIALHQAGFSQAIASLGTALTFGHASLMHRYKKKVIITYDSDLAGINATKKAIPILRDLGISVRILDMHPYKDPDEFILALGTAEFRKRIETAKNAFLWEIHVLKSDFDLADPEQKTHFYRETAQRLAGFSEKLERENYLESVCKEHEISVQDMQRLVNSFGRFASSAEEINLHMEQKKDAHGENDSRSKILQKRILSVIVSDYALHERVHKVLEPRELSYPLYAQILEKLYQILAVGKTDVSSVINDFQENAEAVTEITDILQGDRGVGKNRLKFLEESIFALKMENLDAARIAAVKNKDTVALANITLQQAQLKKKGVKLDS